MRQISIAQKNTKKPSTFVESFFEIIEDDNSFRKNVIDAARTK